MSLWTRTTLQYTCSLRTSMHQVAEIVPQCSVTHLTTHLFLETWTEQEPWDCDLQQNHTARHGTSHSMARHSTAPVVQSILFSLIYFYFILISFRFFHKRSFSLNILNINFPRPSQICPQVSIQDGSLQRLCLILLIKNSVYAH